MRELTHTLHLPPAHAEIYGGPHSEWLRDCLERLPCLQSLLVNGLPFFDHASLLTIKYPSPWRQQIRQSTFPTFRLRLLDAPACSNATSTGLAEALPHFPDLVSLDLSRTLAAKSASVFTQLEHHPNLRVLKLRGLSLKDSDLELITSKIGTRVRSLDISDNQLTDASARLLLNECIKEVNVDGHAHRTRLPPVRHGRPTAEVDDVEIEDLEGHIRKKLTQGFVESLAVEDARHAGLTHIYLSNNNMTVEGVSGLLRSRRLQVLDVGVLATALQNSLIDSSEDDDTRLPLPGVEKLTPILAEYASQKLVYLRINYKIVTEDTRADSTSSRRAELDGDTAIDSSTPSWVDPQAPRLELDAFNTGVYELPGDISQPAELPSDPIITRNDIKHSHSTEPDEVPAIHVTSEGPETAPAPDYLSESAISLVLSTSPSATLPILTADNSPLPSSPQDDDVSSRNDKEGTSTRSHRNSMHYVSDRRARLELRQSLENRLHPGMLPKVRTLTLTDVPLYTDDEEVIHRLKQFIKDCAEEVAIAKLRANHTYMLPPGRSRKVAEREYARNLFALRRIVFEMAPPQTAPRKITTSWRAYPTKSSTEDEDSETFWEAATHDFSFFGDEECGLPTAEPGRGPPLSAMAGLIPASGQPAPPPKPWVPGPPAKPLLDVVAEIGKFRRERKEAHAMAVQSGEADPLVEGHWPGDITVVRKAAGDTGDFDFYGNRFERGWLYR